MEKKVSNIFKNILGIMLVILAITFIYPIQAVIVPIGASIFTDNNSDSDLIKAFGMVKIENYEKYEKIGTEAYGECYAIYFNEEQANRIKLQINNDEKWTDKPFKDKFINDYKKFNISNLGESYYYLVEIDKNYNIIETNRNLLDNKKIEWYRTAIYNSSNKILYYYSKHYEK